MFNCLTLANLSITHSVSVATSLWMCSMAKDDSRTPVMVERIQVFIRFILMNELNEHSHDAEVVGIVSNTQRISHNYVQVGSASIVNGLQPFCLCSQHVFHRPISRFSYSSMHSMSSVYVSTWWRNAVHT